MNHESHSVPSLGSTSAVFIQPVETILGRRLLVSLVALAVIALVASGATYA
jgi:plastocyanin domain-containing protein